MQIYLYSGLFLIGLILAYFALKQYKETHRIISNGVRTEAEVADYKTVMDSEGEMFKPVFNYFIDSGVKKQFVGEVASAVPAYSIGDKVKIVYNPTDDKEVKLDSFWGLYRWTIILLALASPFLIIGGAYLLYALI